MSQYEYIDEDTIDDGLKCAICSQPFQSPVNADCTHTFCLSCINTWIQMNASCPICRRALRTQDMLTGVPSQSLLDQLDGLRVRCLKCKKTEIRRADFEAHLKRCSKRRISKVSSLLSKPWRSIKATTWTNNQHRVPVTTPGETMNTHRALQNSTYSTNQWQVPDQRSVQSHANASQGASVLAVAIGRFLMVFLMPMIVVINRFVTFAIPLFCIIICAAILLLLYLDIFWKAVLLIFVVSCCLILRSMR